mmetsp:Transcript_28538/g.90949  ORF Transcript_28538/g.90949 Transcript_28538/m.90949 type:complete len:227 (+) Transcript_28538:125-805(+)
MPRPCASSWRRYGASSSTRPWSCGESPCCARSSTTRSASSRGISGWWRACGLPPLGGPSRPLGSTTRPSSLRRTSTPRRLARRGRGPGPPPTPRGSGVRCRRGGTSSTRASARQPRRRTCLRSAAPWCARLSTVTTSASSPMARLGPGRRTPSWVLLPRRACCHAPWSSCTPRAWRARWRWLWSARCWSCTRILLGTSSAPRPPAPRPARDRPPGRRRRRLPRAWR